MTAYESSFNIPVAFPKDAVSMGLGEVVSRHGLRQLRLAETENTPTSPTFLMVG